MNSIEFVDAIREHAGESAVQGVLRQLRLPTGRSPDPKTLEESKWYLSLTDDSKKMVERVVREAAMAALFGLFCVLDHVRAIEDGEDKGRFELYYVRGGERVFLNAPRGDLLHELL